MFHSAGVWPDLLLRADCIVWLLRQRTSKCIHIKFSTLNFNTHHHRIQIMLNIPLIVYFTLYMYELELGMRVESEVMWVCKESTSQFYGLVYSFDLGIQKCHLKVRAIRKLTDTRRASGLCSYTWRPIWRWVIADRSDRQIYRNKTRLREAVNKWANQMQRESQSHSLTQCHHVMTHTHTCAHTPIGAHSSEPKWFLYTHQSGPHIIIISAVVRACVCVCGLHIISKDR